jgi:hypothetical protein
MVPWIIDDAFIEMRVARNIALGLGFTYDGFHPTTGSPFLWTYLTALNHFLPSLDAAVKATIIECAIFGGFAAVTVYAIAWAATGRSMVGWVAFWLATLTGNAFFSGMNGMETTFFSFFLILTIATYIGVGRPKHWGNMQWGMVVGLCGGIATLTRADGIFVLFAISCVEALDILRRARRQERQTHLQYLSGILITGSICFVTLLLWNMISTGSWQPANQVGRRELALALHNFSFENFSFPHYLHIVVWNTIKLEELITIAIGASLLGLIALVHGAFGTLDAVLKRFTTVLAIYSGTFFVMLIAYQWYFPDFHGLRYINASALLIFVLVASLLVSLSFRTLRKTFVCVLTMAIIGISWVDFRTLSYTMPWAPVMSFSASPTPEQVTKFWKPLDWLRDNLPEGTVVGVRDHGRFAVFTGKPVQDIAGNIDPIVVQHLKQGSLPQFLQERNVTHLFIPSLEQRNDTIYQALWQLPLERVEAAPPDRMSQLYRIAWEKWQEAQ